MSHASPPVVSAFCPRSWGGTDVGLQRQRNEDAYYLDDQSGTYLVVDGMGGEAAGDVAAEIVCRLFVERVERVEGTAEERVREAIALGNNAVIQYAGSHPGCERMGCVMTAAIVENGHLVVGHVGDTRLYRVTAAGLQKLTRDHSPVGAREDRGEISEAEAMRHPSRSVVDRALGTSWLHPDDALADIVRVPIAQKDRYLLCSDGLTDQVGQSRIFDLIWKREREPAIEDLLAEANQRGGVDNTTVILVDFLPRRPDDSGSRRRGFFARFRR